MLAFDLLWFLITHFFFFDRNIVSIVISRVLTSIPPYLLICPKLNKYKLNFLADRRISSSG